MKEALKILYIFLAGIGVFFIDNIWILIGVFSVHLLLYFIVPGKENSLKFLWRVRWFVILLFLFDALVGPNDIPLIQLKKWTLAFSYSGLLSGTIMALKLFSMLTITQVIRKTMRQAEFVKGLTGLGMSASSAEIVDQIMTIVTEESQLKGKGHGKGSGKGRGAGKNSVQDTEDVKAKDVLFRGKVGNIPKKLAQRITSAKERFAGNPNAVLASASLSVTLIRMVKIAPGLPLAPGHKNIVLMPVFIFGIARSGKKFAGTQIGFISGILHFAMGFGKYGPIGIFQFAVLGFFMDILLWLFVKKTNLVYLAFVGAIGGLVRISTDIILALMLDASELFYLVYLPYILSQMAFGAASAFISRAILKQIE